LLFFVSLLLLISSLVIVAVC